MANKFQSKAKLVERIEHNQKFIECVFEVVMPFCQPLLAGQYVSLKVGEPNTLRSYSICSNPADSGRFNLMVDVTPQGIGTTFLQKSEIGTEVEILGPLGRFTLSDGVENKPVVLIGTGSGVAPLRAMILDLLRNRKTTQEVKLLWGERFFEDLIWQEELKNLVSEFPNFKYMPVISRPEETDQCTKGRVTDCLQGMEIPNNGEYYLCGGKAMIDDVVVILQNKGVAPTSIFHEKFD